MTIATSVSMSVSEHPVELRSMTNEFRPCVKQLEKQFQFVGRRVNFVKRAFPSGDWVNAPTTN